MNKTVSSSFNKSDNILSVTLYSNGFTKEGEMIGRVTRNTVTLENMIADIIDENRGMDPYMVQHSAILLQQQIIKMLQQGKCVNVLDLGTLYIGLKGCIKGKNPDSSAIPDFAIRFTPSTIANETLKSLQVDKVVIADKAPQINIITNTWNNQEDCVSSGKICRISGNHLKLGGDSYSLSLIPLAADGTESDTLPPVHVPIEKVIKNVDKLLEFYVPEELDTSVPYLIRVRTSFISSTKSRKDPLITDSSAVTVIN